MSNLAIYWSTVAFLYSLLLILAGIASMLGGPDTISRAQWITILILPPPAGGVAVLMHWLLGHGVTSALGWKTGGDPGPMLAQARVFMKQEKWEDARLELDKAWTQYPGNGLVLREYERLLLEGMHAPSGMCDFFSRALPRLETGDKAYAMLRLAEVNADVLRNKEEVLRWCGYFLREFPAHRDAQIVIALAANMDKADEAPKAGA